nr:DUF3263 domain-containing protein [Rhodococcus opacus]
MTKHEIAILNFAVRWAPFGGGDEHIFPEFGIYPNVFYRRLRRLLDRDADLSHGVRHRLDELCTFKIANLEKPQRSKPPRPGLATRNAPAPRSAALR